MSRRDFDAWFGPLRAHKTRALDAAWEQDMAQAFDAGMDIGRESLREELRAVADKLGANAPIADIVRALSAALESWSE